MNSEAVEFGREEADDVVGPVGEVVPDALDTTVVGDNAAAVAMDQSEDELLSCSVYEGLLPRFEGDPPVVFTARTVLGDEARPVF